VIRVDSAAEMEAVVAPRAPDQDVIVMAAAVADFRPAAPADHKIKKGDEPPRIVLEPTHDFLVDLGERKPPGQVLVGFAAETDDLLANARAKLERKRLDLIVANDVSAPGVGFEHDTNQVVILSPAGMEHDGALSDKRAVAAAVIDAVVAARAAHR
jgi:phosphopantothenoylcysteine decarboxylase/phosphopantothenate--cysteine ligase